ncbi:TfoX N-terminal domain-containing protein [Nocardia amikacinitolerans]|uniref:TfoX/Sxy family protein n=1 Tax=Nocardia amikacinitolerans TaxID=756689 RepID=UPI0020A58ED1|nr:TfoX/Sxy family protein [Nocardia amikacinitolerans]MCP2296513.1 TfoX N-terminal domain-containing protein [Nocardia amikacinitolerans]
MTYDEELAERIRDYIDPGLAVTEQKMFGGLAFLIGGNMAVSAVRDGGLLVRVAPTEAERLLDDESVTTMTMGSREMHGWLHVAPAALGDDTTLREWVDRGVGYARSLPTKK